jgi:VWA domain-containing protein
MNFQNSRTLSVRPGVALGLLCGALAACSSDASPGGSAGPNGAQGNGVNFGDDVTASDTAQAVPGYFDGEACAGQSAGAEAAPAVLQLLVDTSGSMDQNAPGARGSKWTVTRRAVLDAIDGMPGETSLGVVFYPNVPNNSDVCFRERTAVTVAALATGGQRQRIQQAFARQNPEGGTPTHDAYRYALAQLEATPAAGSRFVVLITDGIPTYLLGCQGNNRQNDPVDAGPLVVEAAAAAARGIRTFVIGSPGSEGARSDLSRMAEAGGTGTAQCSHTGPNYCHFDMTSETDLGAGLESALGIISGLALSCRYGVPEPPVGSLLDPGKVNVLFTPPGGPQELIGRSADASCSEGWEYAQGETQIRLCGSTCQRVQDSEGSLTLQFGCSTILR